jgi:hypothetical protein
MGDGLFGLIRFEPTDTDRLLPSLCNVVRAGASGDQLLTAARQLLYEHLFVIPGTERRSNLVQAAISTVERESLTLIEREIPPIMRNRWLEALSRQFARERKMTLLEYLQEPPRKFAPSTVERQSDTVNRPRSRCGLLPDNCVHTGAAPTVRARKGVVQTSTQTIFRTRTTVSVRLNRIRGADASLVREPLEHANRAGSTASAGVLILWLALRAAT